MCCIAEYGEKRKSFCVYTTIAAGEVRKWKSNDTFKFQNENEKQFKILIVVIYSS